MTAFLKFSAWPAIAGLLAAMIILQNWILPGAASNAVVTRDTSYRGAVATAIPSVVNIYTEKVVTTRSSPMINNPLMPIPRSVPRQRIEQSLGSGVIMSESGYILTNNHVVEGADAIGVVLSDGRASSAEIVGGDRYTDLALLKINLENLNVMELADSDYLSVGDVVLAIGNPLGFGHSVTQGIVSGLGRFSDRPGTFEGLIQTDAVIHAGNSGGALVDTNGKLIGINRLTWTATDSYNGVTGIGISLAIPSNIAEFVMDDLIRYGRVIRGWLGIEVEQVPNPNGNSRNILRVLGVTPNGPAERAGLQPGDIITHFENEPVDDALLVMYEVSLLRPGDQLNLTVNRASAGSVDLTAVITTQPENLGAATP
ncbi:MAG: trypsin-like peptidase domain-containing protein [Pseudomonadota bacterium]